ncbi:MAG: hypothetical protein WAL63_07800 [Solirubrobacteraceae bacterium]
MSASADQPPRPERSVPDVRARGAERRLYAIDGGADDTSKRAGGTGAPATRSPRSIDLARLQRAVAHAGWPNGPAVASPDGGAEIVALHRPRATRAPGPDPIDRGAA